MNDMDEQGSVDISGEARIYGPVTGHNRGVITTHYAITIDAHAGALIALPAPRPSILRRAEVPLPPFPPRIFYDRLAEQEQLKTELQPRGGAWLHGRGGCGCSSLLRTVANLPEAAAFPDGILFLSTDDVAISLDASGTPRPAHLDDVAQIVFDRFYSCNDVTHRVRVSFHEAVPSLQALQALFILDQVPVSHTNLVRLRDALARSVAFVAANGSAPDTMLDVEVKGLPLADALKLCASIAHLDQGHPDINPLLGQLCRALDCLPLPLVLAAHLIRNGTLSLEQLVTMLEALPDERDPLTQAVRLVLQILTPEDQAALRALIGAGGSHADLATLAAISQPPGLNLEQSLERLAELRLVRVNADRYEIASVSLRRVLQQMIPYAAERRQAVAFFTAAVAHHAGDLEWLERELSNLIAAAHTAFEQGQMTELGQLARGIQPLLVLRGLWRSWGQVITWADQAAQATADQALSAWVLHERGTRAGLFGKRTLAARHLRKALEIRRKLGDTAGAAATQRNLSALNLPVVPPAIPWQRWLAGVFFVIGVMVLIGGRLGAPSPQPLPPTSNPVVIAAMPPATPTPSPPATPTPSPIPTATSTPSPIPTATSTSSPIPTATATPTRTPTATPVPTATPIPTPTRFPTRVPPPATDAAAELQVIAFINQERRRNRCDVELQVVPELTAAARRHSYDMAANAFLGHTGSDGSRPDDRIEEAGYLWAWGTPATKGWAENAAPFATPAETVQGWMRSPGHRSNMLNCGYREVGVGYARSESGQNYWTAVFTIGRR